MLDRKATSHTKNNDIYSSWVHAHFKMKLITMSEVQCSFFTPSLSLSLSLSHSFLSFIYPPPAPSPLLQNSGMHVNLRNATLFPFWQGPWLSRWHVDVKHFHSNVFIAMRPHEGKEGISEPIHSTGRGLEMCLEFVCLCMKRSLSCQIWGMTLSTPSDSLHHRWHHLLAWLMLNSTAEAHRRWGTVYCTAPLLAVDLSGAIILIVSEAPVMNNWWQKQLMNTTSELWIRKKEGNWMSITVTALLSWSLMALEVNKSEQVFDLETRRPEGTRGPRAVTSLVLVWPEMEQWIQVGYDTHRKCSRLKATRHPKMKIIDICLALSCNSKLHKFGMK